MAGRGEGRVRWRRRRVAGIDSTAKGPFSCSKSCIYIPGFMPAGQNEEFRRPSPSRAQPSPQPASEKAKPLPTEDIDDIDEIFKIFNKD